MASIRRALFPSTPNSDSERCTDNSLSVLSCTEASESSNTEKECGNSESEEFHEVVLEENTDRASTKVLVTGVSMTEDICTQLSGMPLLQDISVISCSPNNLLSICSKEKFILVFVDKYCEEGCISKICSTLRYNSSSLNTNTPIIGVSDADRDDTSNYGLNEVVTFPLREDVVNQLLLKFAGIIPFKGLPLTPESPDDDVAVARKAAEIIRESEEQSMLNFSKDSCVPKDSNCNKEVKSTFDSPEEPDSHSKQITCSLYPNSNNSLYIPSPSPLDQDHINTRQPSLNYNTTTSQEFPRSTGSSIYDEDPFRTREHTSWGSPQDFPLGHMTQNVVTGQPPGMCSDHSIGCHGYTSVSGIYQHNYPTVPVSNQLPWKPTSQYLAPNSTYNNKPQEKPMISQDVVEPTVNMASSVPTQVKMNTFGTPAYMVSGAPGSKDMKITVLPEDLSKHSSKERIRRERIKESCDRLRYLLPNISGKKTDMASILEMTVKFVELVNERTPSPVMQEIAESLSANTTSLCRKRSPRELAIHPSKQAKPRTRFVSSQLSVPVVPSVIPTDTQGHYRLRGPPVVGNNGPMYLSHVRGQHCTSGPHQYNQYPPTINYGSSYNPLIKDIQGGFYPGTHTSVVNQGYSCNASKDIPVVQAFPPPQTTSTQMCHPMNTQINVCLHRPIPANTSVTNSNMPQQWNFLKLPPINTISPCSSTHFSRSSSEEQSAGSSSPSGSLGSPLWDEPKNSSCL